MEAEIERRKRRLNSATSSRSGGRDLRNPKIADGVLEEGERERERRPRRVRQREEAGFWLVRLAEFGEKQKVSSRTVLRWL